MQYTVEHYSTNNGQQQQHQQFQQEQHFQTEHFHHPTHVVPIPIVTSPAFINQTNSYEVHETIAPAAFRLHHQHPVAHFESHSSEQTSSTQQHQQQQQALSRQEKLEKKTVQTTTTTTTTNNGQPYVVTEEYHVSEVTEPLNQEQHITVKHYPIEKKSWSNWDTYLHIFLTFFFGHLAAVLFFDGIIRNFANLYVLEHTYFSQTIYVIHILFSIAMIAFIIWFLTVCWRWWRNKSLEVVVIDEHPTQPTGGASTSATTAIRRETRSTFRKHALVAAIILIIGFIIYLILGLLDLSFKSDQEFHRYGNYNPSQYMCDVAIFIFRLVFWAVGIVALLMLSRHVFYKRCCPSKQIKIGKEKPVTVYQVNA
jgi:hypothetical protein